VTGEQARVEGRTRELAQTNARLQAEVTEGMRAEAEARALQARLAGILDLADDSIISVDEAQRITLFNYGAQMTFGYAPAEVVGRPLDILLPERFREAHRGHIDTFARSPERSRRMGERREIYGRRKDSTEFPAEASISKFEGEHERRYTVILRDITARVTAEQALRRAKEEAEQANRAKSEFLSRMSHELRTPLNAVLGFAQLLEMDPLSPDQHGRVSRILRGGRHLLDLINEILDISRIESGRLPLSPEPVRLADALREAIDLIRPLAAERRITVQTEPIADPQCYTIADRQRLKQVLLNLLANAVKYNRESGRVTVSCTPVPEGRVRVAVADTGPGIPPEKLGRLFQPFDRLGAETTEVEGTGLGLALSKGLVEAMGGVISVESRPGEGSTFAVELRAAEGPIDRHERLGARVPQQAVTAAAPATRTVLYVEDNLPNLELIEQIFARWPWINLLSAMQGRLGLDFAARHRPDLILLDLHLPDLSGSEVLRLLQEGEATRDIPVVVISADATPGQIDRLLSLGARTYLTKPLDVPRFLALVREILHPDES
jgi:PAS domain S-box-containing protein